MQKLIYVRSEDEPLIEQVQAIEGQSLSAVVVSALREYIQRHQHAEGFEPMLVRVGKHLTTDGGGVFRKVSFDGRLLAESKVGSRDRIEYHRFAEFEVYLTSESEYVLVVKDWEQENLGSTLSWYYACRVFKAGALQGLQAKYGGDSTDYEIADLIAVAEEALVEWESLQSKAER